jgi:cation:H+ antiporter
LELALNLGFVVLGLVLLVGGGDLLVRGAVRLALLFSVAPAVVGVTIVATGTSAPELVVSVFSALEGTPDLAIGNVVGSNIYNIALILGISALITPLVVAGNTVKFEWPVMFLAAVQLHLLGRDAVLDRLEAGFLLTCLVAFVVYTVWVARSQVTATEQAELDDEVGPPPPRTTTSWLLGIAFTVGGLLLLVAGAQSLLVGAVAVARFAGVPEMIIGLTLVAIGTSLPELFTSVIAAIKGQADIAITNVVGSNIFNIFGILGVAGLIVPLPVNPEFIVRDNWWMIGLTVLLLPFMAVGLRIRRWQGAVFVILAGIYSFLLVT